MWKKAVALFFILILSSQAAFSQVSRLVRFEDGHLYSSNDIYEKCKRFAQNYPELIEMEILGYSHDKRPIYVLRMSDQVHLQREEAYVEKKHLLVMAGLHARETYNPFVVIKTIEDYINDYYDDGHLPFVNIKEVLSRSVIHFIPLSNPDGFDVVKFGSKAIRDTSLRNTLEKSIPGPYNRLKGNARMVDLNRNFENYTLDREQITFVSDVGTKGRLGVVNTSPALELYHGPHPASEVETQILQTYMLGYDFRAFLSYHSMGRVLFGYTTRYGSEVAALTNRYLSLASNTTGYSVPKNSDAWAWGYEGRYAVYNTNKPLITVETIPSKTFPTPSKFYKTEYDSHKLNRLPIDFLNEAEKIGYFDYKIYKDNRYVRDMVDPLYALAIANQIGGQVVVYKGPPRLYEVVRVDASETYKGYMSLFNQQLIERP